MQLRFRTAGRIRVSPALLGLALLCAAGSIAPASAIDASAGVGGSGAGGGSSTGFGFSLAESGLGLGFGAPGGAPQSGGAVSPSGLRDAIESLDAIERRRLTIRCNRVMRSPSSYNAATLAVCRALAAL